MKRTSSYELDPNYHYDDDHIPEAEIPIRRLFSEMLRRALEDLRYFRDTLNYDQDAFSLAYKDAKNAQLWIDGGIDDPLLSFDTVTQFLGVGKKDIDNYIDRNEIRFKYEPISTKKQRRKAN